MKAIFLSLLVSLVSTSAFAVPCWVCNTPNPKHNNYDFNRSRAEIYKMNFVRGIFFGLGSVIGGTLIVALILWLLSFFIDIPGIGHSVQQLQQTIQSTKK